MDETQPTFGEHTTQLERADVSGYAKAVLLKFSLLRSCLGILLKCIFWFGTSRVVAWDAAFLIFSDVTDAIGPWITVFSLLTTTFHNVVNISSGLVTSCPTLATPWTVTCQALLSMGFFQARIVEWIATSFSRRSFQLMDQTPVSFIADR